MRTFEDSQKSKKTVASMIERKGDKSVPPKKVVKIVEAKKSEEVIEETSNDALNEDVLMANRRKLAEKLSGKKKAADSK